MGKRFHQRSSLRPFLNEAKFSAYALDQATAANSSALNPSVSIAILKVYHNQKEYIICVYKRKVIAIVSQSNVFAKLIPYLWF